MSDCRSCSGRLFHSVGPVVAKQRLLNWLHDILTEHIMCVQPVTPRVKDMDSPSHQLLHGESKHFSHKGVSGYNNEISKGHTRGFLGPPCIHCQTDNTDLFYNNSDTDKGKIEENVINTPVSSAAATCSSAGMVFDDVSISIPSHARSISVKYENAPSMLAMGSPRALSLAADRTWCSTLLRMTDNNQTSSERTDLQNDRQFPATQSSSVLYNQKYQASMPRLLNIRLCLKPNSHIVAY